MALAIHVVKLLFLVSLSYSKFAHGGIVPLRNPSFESPPTNLRTNASSQFVLLNTVSNVIPGWSFQGTVWYVTGGNSVSLPGNGHGLQLGPNGMISQKISYGLIDDYVLTFTLAPSTPSCANNATAIRISGPSVSKVFTYKGSLGKETWQTYAYALWRDELRTSSITLQIESVGASSRSNSSCWPIIDDLLLTGNNYPRTYTGNNAFLNGGFEVGPSFLQNSTQGILLEAEPEIGPLSPVQSALQTWRVLGTVKYIDSAHYVTPEGRRAVEFISGNPSGIEYYVRFPQQRQITLEFIIGDAGDSCVGDLTVVVQVGTQRWNFPMRSNGLGSSKKNSVTFYASYSPTDVVPISFASYNETRNNDNVLCGPVIDGLFTQQSHTGSRNGGSHSIRLHSGLMIFCFVLASTLLFFV